MRFAVATVEYWTSIGFDCTNWRKSVDGTKAIIHLEFAQTLIPDVESDTNITSYDCPSDELTTLLSGSDWTQQE